MDLVTLRLLFLLPFCFCLDTEETIVKTIGRGTEVFRLCARALLDNVTLIVCKIKTESSTREDGCRLLFDPEKGFEQQCGDRFTLKLENQTVFLRLNNLRPEHSGHYICECSYLEGTSTLHLHVTVEGDDAAISPLTIISCMMVISAAAGFAILAGLILGLTLRKTPCRHRRQSGGLKLDEKEESSYTSLQQPTGDLYQTTSHMDIEYVDTLGKKSASETKKAHLASKEQTEDIYENL
ncbi:uncharacterized protein V3H82_023914 isoform 1-T1 [Fundulus diaphanus]